MYLCKIECSFTLPVLASNRLLPVTLGLLTSLLKSGGMFVQWDWLSNDDSAETGLSENRVLAALEASQLIDINIGKPFEMDSSKGTMRVLMAVGVNP